MRIFRSSLNFNVFISKMEHLEFPGVPVFKLLAFTAKGLGSITGRGTKILQAT